jgi:hypothetical protein
MGKYGEQIEAYLRDIRTNPTLPAPAAPTLGTPPSVPEAQKIPDDLSNYVEFLHPWGSRLLNAAVLLLMSFLLVITTVVTLRAQDIK